LCCIFSISEILACEDPVATVVSVNGSVLLHDGANGATDSRSLKPQDTICPGQQLEVGPNSRAAVYLSNNTFVRLDENTVMSFPQQQQTAGFWVELQQGVSHFISRITQQFGVRTPYANAVVDGTEFLVVAAPDQSRVSVIEGQVTVTALASGQQQPVPGGESLVIGRSGELQMLQVSATDTVDWAIYFPPLLVLEQLQSSRYQQQLDQAATDLRGNRPDLAITELERLPRDDATVNLALATAYLATGNSQAARRRLQNNNSASALALRSLIASTLNQPQPALEFAHQALQQDGQSLPAQVALSYAFQANLDLASALQAAREATRLHPDATLAWVRLSEVQVALGDVSAAADAIAHGEASSPQDAMVLNQAGFINLYQHQYQSARASFNQSLQLNSENPQARLGLGLVMLRQGDLGAGRRQLEYAVSLDPARSVLRSYLGRAYFAEKRDAKATMQWDLAKQLDPEDPTPYFYAGVDKLYNSDPVAAIEQMEKSAQLNQQRGLYRSETLLQSDAASRSALLARAYDQVGFDSGALQAGYRAIQQDNTNAEGHRLIADKYRGRSHYESARASELMQAQLWQSASAYPLQPQINETGIGFLEGAGPQSPGFNEYHSLFIQDGPYATLNGYGGSDGTWGDDVVVSLLAGPLALSLGQYHFESDGWRPNSEQDQDVYSGFVQYDLGSNTSVQLEYGKLLWEKGELSPQLSTLTFTSPEHTDLSRETTRFGLRQRLGLNSYLIASYLQQNSSETWVDDLELSDQSLFTEDSDIDSETFELQYVFKGHNYGLVLGGGVSTFDRRIADESAIVLSMFPLTLEFYDSETGNLDPLSRYVYAYNSFAIGSAFTLEAGLAYDEYSIKGVTDTRSEEIQSLDGLGVIFQDQTAAQEDYDHEINQWSPKLGLVWQLGSYRLAATAFRRFGRPTAAERTIEPTVVAGFNQIFSDPEWTDSKNGGLALSSSDTGSVLWSVQYLRRAMDYDIKTSIDWGTIKTYGDIFEASTSVLLDPQTVLGAALYWDHSTAKGVAADLNVPSEIDNYEVPLSLRLFDQSRVAVTLEQVYYHQKVNVDTVLLSQTHNSSGWVTNISSSYELPRRFGRVVVGVKNLLEQKDEMVNYDASLYQVYPTRLLFAGFNLNF